MHAEIVKCPSKEVWLNIWTKGGRKCYEFNIFIAQLMVMHCATVQHNYMHALPSLSCPQI